MKQKQLVEMAKTFKDSNPRFGAMSVDMVHYAVASQTGHVLSASDYKDFLLYLTGYDFNLKLVEEQLENTPPWLKDMYSNLRSNHIEP